MDTIKTTKTAGPGIVIDCPACQRRAVGASTYDQVERYLAFSLIPLGSHRTSWVVCSGCGRNLLSRVRVGELEGRSPEELSALIVARASLAAQLMAILSVLLCIIPAVGLIAGLIAFAVNRKNRGWTRVVSYIGLGLTAAFHAFLGLLIVFSMLGLIGPTK